VKASFLTLIVWTLKLPIMPHKETVDTVGCSRRGPSALPS
jgi:hypothetical protein